MLGGTSRDLTGVWTSPPMFGIEHITWQGKSATVIILPGKIQCLPPPPPKGTSANGPRSWATQVRGGVFWAVAALGG